MNTAKAELDADKDAVVNTMVMPQVYKDTVKKWNGKDLSKQSDMDQYEKYNGWFVGYVETKSNVYFFATNISITKPKRIIWLI